MSAGTRKISIELAIAAALYSAGLAGTALAWTDGSNEPVKVVRVHTVQGFNWFGNRQSAADAHLARARYDVGQFGRVLGHGSWICSPAGFGQESFCVAR